jgi:hypothetical protein
MPCAMTRHPPGDGRAVSRGGAGLWGTPGFHGHGERAASERGQNSERSRSSHGPLLVRPRRTRTWRARLLPLDPIRQLTGTDVPGEELRQRAPLRIRSSDGLIAAHLFTRNLRPTHPCYPAAGRYNWAPCRC